MEILLCRRGRRNNRNDKADSRITRCSRTRQENIVPTVTLKISDILLVFRNHMRWRVVFFFPTPPNSSSNDLIDVLLPKLCRIGRRCRLAILPS